jgi:hypothetical protein
LLSFLLELDFFFQPPSHPPCPELQPQLRLPLDDHGATCGKWGAHRWSADAAEQARRHLLDRRPACSL